MIHWLWLIPAAAVGCGIGVVVMACLAINIEEDL